MYRQNWAPVDGQTIPQKVRMVFVTLSLRPGRGPQKWFSRLQHKLGSVPVCARRDPKKSPRDPIHASAYAARRTPRRTPRVRSAYASGVRLACCAAYAMRTPGCTPRGVRPGVRRVRAGRTPQAYALLAWAYASGVRPGGWRTPPAAMWGAYARRTPRRTPAVWRTPSLGCGVRLGSR